MANKEESEVNINIEKYRRLVKHYIDLRLYSSALFWADKVVSLSSEDPEDIYWLAQCMYLLKQYHRAAELIMNRGLEKKHVLCYYLAARCFLEAYDLSEAMQVLNCGEQGSLLPNVSFLEGSPKEVQSAILLLKGRVCEEMDNRALAVACYKEALCKDVHCYEAFEALTQHQMLPAWEEEDVLASLPLSEQCSGQEEERLVRTLYRTKLKKYHAPQHEPNEKLPAKLASNLDVAVCEAERHYYNCNYRECLRITEQVLKKDSYHSGCFPVHIACLVDLKMSNKLFYLAHRLVDLYPESAVSWFAVGCYYYLIGKSDPARRYLAKATTLDKLFGPAWLAYGHSFATENEHDQAMAAYFKASQLMKGCHLPLLYIGLENGLTNNIRLADKFLKQAAEIAHGDPFVLHEMGTIAYQNQDYTAAEQHFTAALERIKAVNGELIPSRWEPLYNNLGHTYRKLRKYEEALRMHQEALLLSPMNASTYAAMAFVNALLGNTSEAVDLFHKALGIRRDHTFSTTMLGYLLEQLMVETPPFSSSSETSADSFLWQNTVPYPDIDRAAPPSLNETSTSSLSFEVEMQDTSAVRILE